MRKYLLGSLVLFFIATQNLYAERIQASMSVIDAQKSFDSVNDAVLTLTNNSNTHATMTLKLNSPEGENTYDLRVFDIHKDQNGCTTYFAKLDRSAHDDEAMGYWFYVDLIDNSSCESDQASWQAFVRSGCRCCGQTDSTMTLLGNPKRG